MRCLALVVTLVACGNAPSKEPKVTAKPAVKTNAPTPADRGGMIATQMIDGIEKFRGIAATTSGSTVFIANPLGPHEVGAPPARRAKRDRTFVASQAADGTRTWSASVGCSDQDWGDGVAVAGDGSSVVIGRCFGPEGSEDRNAYFVAKLGAGGNEQWTRLFRYEGAAALYGVAIDGSGAIVIGGVLEGHIDLGGTKAATDRGILVAKLSQQGTHVWSKPITASRANINAITVDRAGDVWIAGQFNEELVLDTFRITTSSIDEAFIAKLAGADGRALWAATLGVKESRANTIAVGSDGAVFIAGSATFPFDAAATKDDPNAALIALEYGPGRKPFVAKYLANGERVWLTNAERTSMSLEDATHLAVTRDGDVVVGGPFYRAFRWAGSQTLTAVDGPDVYVVRLDPDGKPRWARHLGNSEYDQLEGLAIDAAGKTVAAWSTSKPRASQSAQILSTQLTTFAP